MDIPQEQLKELASYLDEFPSRPEAEENDEYWRLLMNELRTSPTTRREFNYTNVQIENFATEALRDRSPSLKLLYDLRMRKLSFDVFFSCLEKIQCAAAVNMFRAAASPAITQHPVPQEVRAGDQIILTCEAHCQPPPPKYLWFRGQKPIPGSTSNTLIISNANRGHSGWYTCRVTNPHINDPQKASVFSKWVEVEVEEPEHVVLHSPIRQETQRPFSVPVPKIIRQPVATRANVGEKINLECQAEGQGVVYDWYKSGKDYRLGQADGRLVFNPAKMEDSGQYHCVAINDGGKVESFHVELCVESPIVIIEQPQDCRGRVSETVSLRCHAEGPPGKQLVYQWYKEKPGSHPVEVGAAPEFRAQLNLSPRREHKIYCKVSLAENHDIAMCSKIAKVTVDTIWFTQQPQSMERYIGERASLFCGAKSVCDQKVTYLWFKQDTREGKMLHIQTCDDGVLTFQHLSQKNWGYYVCQAQNEFQFIKSDVVHVSIEPRPRGGREGKAVKACPMIHFTKQPWSWVVRLGERFRLLCNAVTTGDEPLHYQWYFNGIKMQEETNQQLLREHTQKSDYGSYYCEVKTHNGLARQLSRTARVEVASSAATMVDYAKMGEKKLEQTKAERRLMTDKEERYALEKVALLIGNQRYESSDIAKLVNPENDIRELAKVLEGMNFKVFSLVNLKFREMMKALEVFYEMLAVPGVYALFYFSGHGFSHLNTNYLMPVDAIIPLECDHNIVSDQIGARMQNKLSRAIKILDCCSINKADDVIPPKTPSLESHRGYSNIYEISSCPDNHLAYDNLKNEHSSFNTALRDALDTTTGRINDIFQHVLDGLREADVSMDGGPGQRPFPKGNLADPNISLHDAVMLDDPDAEEKLDKIGHKWKLAHTIPDPIDLDEGDLGELKDMIAAEITFSAEFSNVLLITIKLHLLKDGCTDAHAEFDQDFLENQGVMGEVVRTDPETTDEASVNTFTTSLLVFHLQRLQEGKFTFCVTISVMDTERAKRTLSVYKSIEKPLFARLLGQ